MNRKIFFALIAVVIVAAIAKKLKVPSHQWEGLGYTFRNGFGIDREHRLWAWGWPGPITGQQSSELGNYFSGPHLVDEVHTWKAIAPSAPISSMGSCAIQSNDSLWCWGMSGDGPTPVAKDAAWSMVVVGDYSALGIQKDGTLWGSGDFRGDKEPGLSDGFLYRWTQISTEKNWKVVTSGGWANVALNANGEGWVWGRSGTWLIDRKPANSPGESFKTDLPLQNLYRLPGNDWSTLSAGSGFLMGIKKDGTLWGWEAERSYQPAEWHQINSDTDWIDVQSSDSLSGFIALKKDKTLWASPFPFSSQGNLWEPGLKPAGGKEIYQISHRSEWRSIFGGAFLGAVDTRGRAYIWGHESGRIIDGTPRDNKDPVELHF